MLILFPPKLVRRGRIIDQLRKLFGGTWVYDAANHHWEGENFYVYGVSNLCSPSYPDGEPDQHYITYNRSDTSAQIVELGHSGPRYFQ